MKSLRLILPVALVLAGCQQSTPGGATGGTAAGQTATDSASLERARSLRAEASTRLTVQTPAAAVIFKLLGSRVPSQIDRLISLQGSTALKGSATDRVSLAMALAARPVLAWPVDPMSHQAEAQRWASTMAAAVEVASIAAANVAARLPSRGADDAAQVERLVLKAFEELPHADLAAMLDDLARAPVVLDLAETGGVRMQTHSGATLVLAADGATVTRSGAIRFAVAQGVLDGSTFSLTLDKSTVASLARSRSLASTDEASRTGRVDANAGIK